MLMTILEFAVYVFLCRVLTYKIPYALAEEQFRKTMGHSSLPGLTARESQVALCAGSGMINREIAQELGINKATVSRTLSRSTWKLYRSLRYSL